MKYTSFFVLFFGFFISAAQADMKKKLMLSAYNNYVHPMSGMTTTKDPVLQQSLTFINTNSNSYCSLWTSFTPRYGLNDDAGDELDLLCGISGEHHGLGYDAGIGYVDLVDLSKSTGDLYVVYLALNFPEIHGIKSYLAFENDIAKDADVLDGGLMVKAGVAYDITIGSQLVTLDLSIGGHDGAYGLKPELAAFGRLTVSTTKSFGGWEITPAVYFQNAIGDNEEGAFGNQITFGISTVYLF